MNLVNKYIEIIESSTCDWKRKQSQKPDFQSFLEYEYELMKVVNAALAGSQSALDAIVYTYEEGLETRQLVHDEGRALLLSFIVMQVSDRNSVFDNESRYKNAIGNIFSKLHDVENELPRLNLNPNRESRFFDYQHEFSTKGSSLLFRSNRTDLLDARLERNSYALSSPNSIYDWLLFSTIATLTGNTTLEISKSKRFFFRAELFSYLRCFSTFCRKYNKERGQRFNFGNYLVGGSALAPSKVKAFTALQITSLLSEAESYKNIFARPQYALYLAADLLKYAVQHSKDRNAARELSFSGKMLLGLCLTLEATFTDLIRLVENPKLPSPVENFSEPSQHFHLLMNSAVWLSDFSSLAEQLIEKYPDLQNFSDYFEFESMYWYGQNASELVENLQKLG